jgi:hypothetical protein
LVISGVSVRFWMSSLSATHVALRIQAHDNAVQIVKAGPAPALWDRQL